MVLVVLASLLILGIAFYQSLQGLFSAMIMTILTVLCAAFALGWYDSLGEMLAGRMGAYAHGLSLLALFVIPLLALREAFDRLIPGNVVLGVWADRIGGGALGLVTAFLLVGVLGLVVQLLPMEPTVYQPYDAALQPKTTEPLAWSGGFTLSLAKGLSRGALRPILSSQRFPDVHDDLRLEAFCARSRPKGARASTPTTALKVIDAIVLTAGKGASAGAIAELERIRRSVPKYRRPLTRGDEKVLVVRVAVDQSARNENDDWYRLPATQFRLVTAAGRSFYPVGYLTHAGVWQVNTAETDAHLARVTDILVARPWAKKGGPDKLVVDWVYRLPANETPDHLVFRRTAVATVKAHTGTLSREAQTTALRPKPVIGTAKFSPVSDGLLAPTEARLSHDVSRGAVPLRYVSEKPPAPVRSWAHEKNRLKNIVVSGSAEALNPRGVGTNIGRFMVPSGKVMIQVECRVNPAGKLPAGILSGARPTLLLDDGSRVEHVGAAVLYRKDNQPQVCWYYDWQRAPGPVDGLFAQALADNADTAQRVMLHFLAPADQNRSIVQLELDIPNNVPSRYLFPLELPLRCGRR